MAKQGQKLTDELKEQIRAHLVLSDNKNEIAKKLNVSWATVDKIAKEIAGEPEEEQKFENLREQKKLEMIENIWDDMQSALELGRQKIKIATVALNEFQPTIDKLIDLLNDKEDVKGGDIIEVIKAISSITSIPLSHISTYFGTMYDKQALMQGHNTANVGVNGEVKQTYEYRIEQIIKEDPETAQLLKQLYKRHSAVQTMGDTG